MDNLGKIGGEQTVVLERMAKVMVVGHDFAPYPGVIIGAVRKLDGKLLYLVEDNGRVFIQWPKQVVRQEHYHENISHRPIAP